MFLSPLPPPALREDTRKMAAGGVWSPYADDTILNSIYWWKQREH